MKPEDDRQPRRVGTPAINSQQSRTLLTPKRQEDSSRHAAANVVRGALDEIYSGRGREQTPHTTPAQPATPPEQHQSSASVSQPSHAPAQQPPSTSTQPSSSEKHQLPTEDDTQQSPSVAQTAYASQQARRPQADAEQWKQYHSAWQKYYQLYYERYYTSQLAQKQATDGPTEAGSAQATPGVDQTTTEANAIRELRNTIRHKVADSAKKVRRSKHFIPALAAVVVLLSVVFLQYNQIVFAAVARYTTPGSAEPQNIIVDPTVSVDVTPDPRIVIPKINVDAPVVYGVKSDHKSQMQAMTKGVAHFAIPGASAVPGQQGNTVIAAHSSNDVFASGDYKFIFAQNERLSKDDVMYMNYKGTRYGYTVTKKEVVMPDQVKKVQQKFDKPMLILVSCVPLGTAEKRLLVYAEQVTPDPAGSTKSADDQSNTDTDESDTKAKTMPGESAPTLLERLFGAR